jgi:N-glycosylase/DNA lyase
MPAGTCAESRPPLPLPDTPTTRKVWRIHDYRLDLTLQCGQAFRWQRHGPRWWGVADGKPVELVQNGTLLQARVPEPVPDWAWLENYLQLHAPLPAIWATFPDDPHLHRARAQWHGLRLLRQPAWECLASFLLSSCKRIEQIQQVIERLCRRWGDPLPALEGLPTLYSFPPPARIAAATEAELRACGAGFRAPYLLAAARAVDQGRCPLDELPRRTYPEARAALMKLPGVGPKIADCVCLFGLGFLEAFPVDTWIARVMRERYFRGRRVSEETLAEFGRSHFGPYAGYAQQYLFHDRRMTDRPREAHLHNPPSG